MTWRRSEWRIRTRLGHGRLDHHENSAVPWHTRAQGRRGRQLVDEHEGVLGHHSADIVSRMLQK